MYKATAGVMLPTSVTGSLPRPTWYTMGLGAQSFLEAMMNLRYREQYEDAVSVYLRAQETAGLDICTDGDAHFDEQVGGIIRGPCCRAPQPSEPPRRNMEVADLRAQSRVGLDAPSRSRRSVSAL
jgi:hypothetical protein